MAVFKKAPKLEIDQQAISSIISEGCIIDGSFKAPAFVRIDGHITGDVTVEQGIILGEKGSIKGNVITKHLVAYGSITGNIQAELLEIRETGKITGDIETASIQVDAGAVYNGTLCMAGTAK